jgi:hypothetical protein
LEKGETETEGKTKLRLAELGIIAAFCVLILIAVATFDGSQLTSFDPVKWLTDAVKGFFDWLFNLFFGWLPF